MLPALLFMALLAGAAGRQRAQSLVQTLATGNNPSNTVVNPATGKIYVTNNAGSSVTVFDGATHAVVKTVFASSSPAYLAVNPASNKIYVSLTGNGQVEIINGATDTVTGTLSIGSSPASIAVDPVLNRAFAVNSNSPSVSVIDGVTDGFVGTVPLPATSPRRIAVNPVTHYVYVATATTNTVEVINGQTAAWVRSLPVGMNAFDLAVNPVTNKVYVVGNGTQLRVINGETASTSATVAPAALTTGAGCWTLAVNPVTNKIYTANYSGHSFTVINGAVGATAATAGPTVVINATANPDSLVVDPASNKLWINSPATGQVYEYDGVTNAVAWSTSLLMIPGQLAMNPVTGRLFVTLSHDDKLGVIDCRGNAAAYSSSTGSGVVATAVNVANGKAYLANRTGGSVTMTGSGANKNIPVAGPPLTLAVNPISMKVYALLDGGTGPGGVAIIDSASDTVITTQLVSTGPTLLTLNPVSNLVYELSGGSQAMSVINGATNGVVANFPLPESGTPLAFAINPNTNRGYLLYLSSLYEFHGWDNSFTPVSAGGAFSDLAVNAQTDKILISHATLSFITVVDGPTRSVGTFPTSNPGDRIAVDEAANRIYMVNGTGAAGHLEIADGATFTQLTALNFAGSLVGLAVNPASNTVYVADAGGSITAVDGISFWARGTVSSGISNPALAADPARGRLFASGGSGANNILALTEKAAAAVPLTVSITPFTGNTTTNSALNVNFTAASGYSPTAPAPRTLNYRLESWQGGWQSAASTGGANFSATLPPLTLGLHTLYAWAGDGQEATSTNPMSSPAPGQIAAYTFLVTPPAVTITSQPAGQTACSQATATMYVGAIGDFPLYYRWRRNGIFLTDDAHLTGSQTSGISISPVGAADAGSYDVLVIDPANYAFPSAAATLTVDTAHTPPSEARTLVVFKGAPDIIQWSVPTTGGGYPVTYDVLRSTAPGLFSSVFFATCIATGVSGISSSDSYAGTAYYLVRAKNACGSTLGTDSSGAQIQGRSCP